MTDVVVRAVSSQLAAYIAQTLGNNPTMNISQLTDAINTAVGAFVAGHTPGLDIPLSAIAVDFEANKAELESFLSSDDAWKDRIVAGTGTLITMMVATALTYMQFNIVRSTQETMMDTARIDSSIFAATRHLGVKIARNIPAKCSGTLTRQGDLTNSLTISAYSQFSTTFNTSSLLFNRDTITFPSNVSSISVDLYTGTVSDVVYFLSTGQAKQRYYLGNNDYAVSDVDIICTVNGEQWTRTAYMDYFNIGMWEYGPNDKVFSDDTTADGNVEIGFGNNIFGKIPTIGSQIGFTYVTCNGAADNINMSGSNIKYSPNVTIGGIINTTNSGGSTAISAADYKNLSPGLYAAKYRASTRQDSAAIARKYPGVLDAIFEGQQELAPNDLRQMLIQRATLLTNTTWSSDDFNAFKLWYENLDIANMRIYQNTPTPIIMNITASVYCKDNASLISIQNKITANLINAFQIRAGILGYRRAVSDVGDIIKRTDRALIDYYDLTLPTADVIPDNDEYVVLGTISLNMYYTTRIEQ